MQLKKIPILCIVILMISAAQANQTDFDLLLQQLRQGGINNIDKSINDLEKFTQSNHTNAKALLLLADALMIRYQYKGQRNSDLHNALSTLNEAKEQAPNSDRILQKRALVYLNLGQLDKASLDIEQALQLAPNNLVASALKIELLLANKQNSKAESFAYESLINWDRPAVPTAEYADVFFAAEQWQLALDFYQQLEDKNAHSFFRQGLCHEYLAQHRKAINSYRKSLAKQDQIDVRHRMIDLLLASEQIAAENKFPIALRESRVLLLKNPQRADTWQLFAKLYEQQGNASRALAAWINVRRFSNDEQYAFANKRIDAFASLPKMN